MIAMKNVLVATDFSPVSETALVYGRALARTFDATLHVLHVVDNLAARLSYADASMAGFASPQVQADLEGAARKSLDSFVTETDRRELDATPVLRVGNNAAKEIVEYAQEASDRRHRDGRDRARCHRPDVHGQRRRQGHPARTVSGADGSPPGARVRDTRCAASRGAPSGLIMPLDAAEWPALSGLTSDRLILRDGSVAVVRPTTATDRQAIEKFFHRLTSGSRYRRFFAASEPSAQLIERSATRPTPPSASPFVALRHHAARASADRRRARTPATGTASAEAAFAVSDDLHGKGLGTALLERLATIAHAYGFERFEATTLADNLEMLEVFRDSGFEMRAKTVPRNSSRSVLDLQPSARGTAAIDERNRFATVASLRPILQPRSIAVIGVSRKRANLGRRMYEELLRAGFNGSVYAVNPHARRHRRAAYATRSVRDLPHRVDLAVVATPRHAVPARRRRLRRGGCDLARHRQRRLRGAGPRGANAAATRAREGPDERHASGRPELHGGAQY